TTTGTGVLTALGINVGSSGAFVTNNAANTFTGGDQTVSGASLIVSGNISAAAWTTNGIKFRGAPGTLTDTSSSGTVAAAYTNVYGGNTIAATNVTTFTDYFTTFLNDPVAGSNVTLTRKWSLGLEGNLKAVGMTLTGLATHTIGAANTGVMASTGYSLTGSNATNMIDLAGTWNTSGNPIVLKIAMTDTASGATTKFASFLAGAAGATEVFSVSRDPLLGAKVINGSGSVTLQAGSTYGAINSNSSSNHLWLADTNAGTLVVRGGSGADRLSLSADNSVVWTSSGGNAYNTAIDVTLARTAAGSL